MQPFVQALFALFLGAGPARFNIRDSAFDFLQHVEVVLDIFQGVEKGLKKGSGIFKACPSLCGAGRAVAAWIPETGAARSAFAIAGCRKAGHAAHSAAGLPARTRSRRD